MPTPLAKSSMLTEKPRGHDKPFSANLGVTKMQSQFSRIGMNPNLFKLEKVSYARVEVTEIAHKMGKKLDELE